MFLKNTQSTMQIIFKVISYYVVRETAKCVWVLQSIDLKITFLMLQRHIFTLYLIHFVKRHTGVILVNVNDE